MIPTLGQVVERRRLAQTPLVATKMGFNGIKQSRQVVLHIQLVPVAHLVTSRLIGQGLGIVVQFRVAVGAQAGVTFFRLFGLGLPALAGLDGSLGRRLTFEAVGALLGHATLLFGFGLGGGGRFERPVPLRAPTRQTRKGEGIVGCRTVVDYFPFIFAEIVQKFFQQLRTHKAAFSAADYLIFPDSHKFVLFENAQPLPDTPSAAETIPSPVVKDLSEPASFWSQFSAQSSVVGTENTHLRKPEDGHIIRKNWIGNVIRL